MRIFNTSGACIPEIYYTVMREALVAQGEKLVAMGVHQRKWRLSHNRADAQRCRNRRSDGPIGRQSLGQRLLRPFGGSRQSLPRRVSRRCAAPNSIIEGRE